MPMYFPDLESVKRCAEMMAEHQKPENKYTGIVPQTEDELSEARRQLGTYFRNVWKDEIQALEIELGVTEEDYDIKMKMAIASQLFGSSPLRKEEM